MPLKVEGKSALPPVESSSFPPVSPRAGATRWVVRRGHCFLPGHLRLCSDFVHSSLVTCAPPGSPSLGFSSQIQHGARPSPGAGTVTPGGSPSGSSCVTPRSTAREQQKAWRARELLLGVSARETLGQPGRGLAPALGSGHGASRLAHSPAPRPGREFLGAPVQLCGLGQDHWGRGCQDEGRWPTELGRHLNPCPSLQQVLGPHLCSWSGRCRTDALPGRAACCASPPELLSWRAHLGVAVPGPLVTHS